MAKAWGLCSGINVDHCGFPLSVSEHVISSSPSLNHSPHSLICLLTHSLTHCSRQPGGQCCPNPPAFKITTLPPVGQADLSPRPDDVPHFEIRPLRTISGTHSLPLIYTSSLGERQVVFYQPTVTRLRLDLPFACHDGGMISRTKSLPLWARYSHTAISQVQGINSEIVLGWRDGARLVSRGGRVIIRYDHQEMT